MTTPIEIDYQALSYIVVGLFALLGFSRGWFKEAFTTILLMGMVLMLSQPELASRLIAVLFTLVETVINNLVAKLFQDPTTIQDLLDAVGKLLNTENPYSFMLALTAFLIVVSYTVGKRAFNESKLAPFSRLLGGTLGAMNGFVVISLMREYLLTRLGITVPGGALSAPGGVTAARAPQQVPVSIKNLYSPYALSGVTLFIVLALGLVVLIFFLREVQANRPPKAKKG